MEQQPIRPYNDETYSIEEGAALIAELNARTEHAEDGYNSIAELSARVKEVGTPRYELTDFGDYLLFNSAGAVTTNAEIENYINAEGFEIKAGRLGVFHIALIREINGVPTWVREQYRFIRNDVLGTYGTGSTNGEIEYADFDFITNFVMFTPPANSEIINLGDIGTDTIEDHLAALPDNTHALLDNGTTYYFKCTISGNYKIYEYKGSLPVNFGNTTPVAIDFDLISDAETPVEPTIPTEEQIKGTAQLELTATGAITATFNTHSMLYINQTGNVTLSVTLPTLAIGEKVTRLIWVKPNGNTFGLPTELTDTMSGEVDVAKTNWIAVTYIRIDGSTIVQFSNCTSL